MKTMNLATALFLLLLTAGACNAESGLFDAAPERMMGAQARWAVNPAFATLDKQPDQLSIVLDGIRWQARRTGTPVQGLWTGEIDSVRRVVLRHDGRHAHGFLHLGSRQYALRPSASGGHELIDILEAQDFHDEVSPVPITAQAHAAAARAVNSAQQSLSSIDVLVVFSDDALAGAGGLAAAHNLAAHAVDMQNSIISHSDIPGMSFNLVGVLDVAFDESADSLTDLDASRTHPQITAARDALGADIVVTVLETLEYNVAGRAYLQIDPGPGFADFAFAVIRRTSMETSLVFSHEVGHLLGMEHDPVSPTNPPNDASFPWSFAQVQFVDQDYPEGFVTTMGNIGSCGGSPPCYRLPYYSNAQIQLPDAPVFGRAMGLEGERENALTAFEIAPIVAAFRVRPEGIFASGFGD